MSKIIDNRVVNPIEWVAFDGVRNHEKDGYIETTALLLSRRIGSLPICSIAMGRAIEHISYMAFQALASSYHVAMMCTFIAVRLIPLIEPKNWIAPNHLQLSTNAVSHAVQELIFSYDSLFAALISLASPFAAIRVLHDEKIHHSPTLTWYDRFQQKQAHVMELRNLILRATTVEEVDAIQLLIQRDIAFLDRNAAAVKELQKAGIFSKKELTTLKNELASLEDERVTRLRDIVDQTLSSSLNDINTLLKDISHGEYDNGSQYGINMIESELNKLRRSLFEENGPILAKGVELRMYPQDALDAIPDRIRAAVEHLQANKAQNDLAGLEEAAQEFKSLCEMDVEGFTLNLDTARTLWVTEMLSKADATRKPSIHRQQTRETLAAEKLFVQEKERLAAEGVVDLDLDRVREISLLKEVYMTLNAVRMTASLLSESSTIAEGMSNGISANRPPKEIYVAHKKLEKIGTVAFAAVEDTAEKVANLPLLLNTALPSGIILSQAIPALSEVTEEVAEKSREIAANQQAFRNISDAFASEYKNFSPTRKIWESLMNRNEVTA